MLRYSFGNIDGKAYGLNANELSVYEAIGKCSRKDDARGWYADLQTLADQLPHRINRRTVSRAVDKLLTLGLIRRDGNSLFTCGQNVHASGQNVHADGQNVRDNGQIVLPPNNPPIIINNMIEKEKEQQRALHARDCDEQQDCLFEKFWKYFAPSAEYQNRRAATQMIFKARSVAAQKAMISSLSLGEGGERGNPYFFVSDFPEPTPTNWSGTEEGGKMLDDGRAKIALYNGKYGVYSLEDIRLYNLQLSDYQRGRQ